ncbi:MAG: CRISPR-associated protein Cas4 [Planctomycetaceae bacterium]|nr:CRISPR-associated protein Cas4 [Planctomycetaceae bacterium]
MTAALRLAEAPAPQPVIRVSDLRQWVYCPRVAWFTLMCPVGKVESYKMRMGRMKEDRLARLQKRRSLHAFRLHEGTVHDNVRLHSERLGLTGMLDRLIWQEGRAYPVEVKFTSGPARLNHRVQLAGYAMLLREVYRVDVPHGYIVRLPDETVDRIDLDAPLMETTNRLLESLREMISAERAPPPSPIQGRCSDCEYRNFCGDVS